MSNVHKRADAVLEPELRELCGELTPKQRMMTAEKFLRWVNQLTSSVQISNPELVKPLPPPKVPRGFFLVNCSEGQQEEMRRLARKCGDDLRGLINWAMIVVQCSLRERIRVAELAGVNPRVCLGLAAGSDQN
jgi:hypothetical protein